MSFATGTLATPRFWEAETHVAIDIVIIFECSLLTETRTIAKDKGGVLRRDNCSASQNLF